uniref:BHLH domain-containing protein n=1 Tax=Labrus bergylta TaxID=56723 RepID=A0A3Q3H1M4_9LABR
DVPHITSPDKETKKVRLGGILWMDGDSRSNFGSGFRSAVSSRTLRSQHSPENAARERSRVRNLRQAFHSLQAALPSVPPDTKLSKLDVLVLATNYIAHLTETLHQGGTLADHTLSARPGGYLHPVKVWKPSNNVLDLGWEPEGRRLKSRCGPNMEVGLVAGEVPDHLLSTAEVPLSKAPNPLPTISSGAPTVGSSVTLTALH